ncbi:hypothetical protein [Roseibium sp. TrichSKD4]|uniref:hypothetical protein n=1 Tax=Roseibium sp. TrichSKD4 TaxID=744980 RepID=UPI001112B785|nr:hypothetical protein [Roseibium sp. TrichSKD4]
MKRRLSICRDLALGREAPYSSSGSYQVDLVNTASPGDLAALATFTDDQWARMKLWCRENEIYWHMGDIAAPVGELEWIRIEAEQKGW